MPHRATFDRQVSPLIASEIAALLLLRLMCDGSGEQIEDAVCLGLGRALETLDQWERLAGLVVAPGTPFDPAALPAIGELKAMIGRCAWLLPRMAALTPPAPPEP